MTATQIDAEHKALEGDLTNYLVEGGRLAVIKAPPGSGKTHLLIAVIEGLAKNGLRVAVAAQTNAQADDICRRIVDRNAALLTVRFAAKGHEPPDEMPASVVWETQSKSLGHGAGVTVGTTAKWALTDLDLPFDVLAVDEAWQMAWADLMQCALISERFMLIGDPGQIPPVVTIDVRRWETSPRAPHDPAPNIVLRDPDLMEGAFVGSLPACRRLPFESVDFVRPFYDFGFAAYVEPGSRGVDLPDRHRLKALSDGLPLAVTLATPSEGPPLEVDHGIAAAAAALVQDLLCAGAEVRDGRGPSRRLTGKDVGLTSSHRVMNSAIGQALAGRYQGVRVDTPERWQGLERPLMIAVHPLSGVVDPSTFDLETGRLCVMASRHQAALIVLTRDHVGQTLADLVPKAEQAPGKPDIVGRGHDAHIRFWRQLENAGRLIALD